MDIMERTDIQNQMGTKITNLAHDEDNEPIFNKPREISDWIKVHNKDDIFQIVEHFIKDPTIVYKPYEKLVTQQEFVQIIIHVVSLLSSKMTFVETPIKGEGHICNFLQVTPDQLKRMSTKYAVPIAELNHEMFSTKERLSTWMNYVIDKYPYRRFENLSTVKKNLVVCQSKLEEAKKAREFIINKTDFSEEQVDYLTKRITVLEKNIDKISKKMSSESELMFLTSQIKIKERRKIERELRKAEIMEDLKIQEDELANP